MAEQASNPETEPEDGASGVGSGADDVVPGVENASMDPRADLEQLDDSLSAMTDLLLSDGEDDDFDLEGDFAPAGAEAAGAGTADIVEQLEQVEAAVSAVLDETAGSDAEAEEEVEPDATGQTEAGHDSAVDAANEALEAVAESLEASDPTETERVTAAPHVEEDAQGAPPREDEAAEPETQPKTPDNEASSSTDADAEVMAASMETAGEPSEIGSDDTTTDIAGTEREPLPASESAATKAPDALEAGEEAVTGDVSATQETATPQASACAVASGTEAQGEPTSESVSPDTPGKAASDKVAIKTKVVAIVLPICRMIWGRAGDLLVRGTEPLAEYLAEQPKVMRQSLAWLALWTAFNAGAVWSYLLLFRSTDTKVNPSAMTHIAGVDALPESTGGTGSETEGLDPAAALLLNPVQN